MRERDHRSIEGFLAKQLQLTLQQVTDMAPAFLKHSYVLEITGPDNFTLTHEKNGRRYSSNELRPNGRDFMEQFREAVGKSKGREQSGPALPDGGIEM